jgi:hypothetical protein
MGEVADAAAVSPHDRLGMLSHQTAPVLLQEDAGNELAKSARPHDS